MQDFSPCTIKSSFKEDNIHLSKRGTCRILVEENNAKGFLYLVTPKDPVYFDDEVSHYTSIHEVKEAK